MDEAPAWRDPIWGELAEDTRKWWPRPRVSPDPWARKREEALMGAVADPAAEFDVRGSGFPEDAEVTGQGDEGAGEEPGSLYLEGSGQLTLDVGGTKPTSSSLRIVGGKVEVGGSYKKGELIEATVLLRVDEIAFRDTRDSQTGNVVSTDRAHKATIVELRA